MDRRLKKIYEEYQSLISEIPQKDQGEIIYKKHEKYLDNIFKKSDTGNEKDNGIKDFLDNIPLEERAYHISKLYYSMNVYYVKVLLHNLKKEKNLKTIGLFWLIGVGFLIKLVSNKIRLYKKYGKDECFNDAESFLDEMVDEFNIMLTYLNPHINDILEIIKEGNTEYGDYVNNMYESNPESYKEFKRVFDEVIGSDNDFFGLNFNSELDDEFRGNVLFKDLEAIISGEFFKKRDGYYSF